MARHTRRSVLAAGSALAAALVPGTPSAPSPAARSPEPPSGPRRARLPGLFDLQVNGFAGVDFGDPAATGEQLLAAVDAIGTTGVTRFVPTLITSSLETFAACARRLARLSSPAIAGLHMEGPYISPQDGYRGAHERAFVRDADVDDFRRRQDAAEGRIRIAHAGARSRPARCALVEHAVAAGVRVAIGHTAASGAQIADAVRAGATLSTHLGNGCASIAAPPPERDLGAAGRGPAARELHRGRPPPAARDRARDGAGQDARTNDPRHRRDGGRGHAARSLHDRRPSRSSSTPPAAWPRRAPRTSPARR